MRNIDKFKIAVPELGDRPDITVVSDAINGVGDAYSGTIEMVKATRSGAKITVSSSRKIERSSFYDGLTIQFVSSFNAKIGEITQVQVDTLPVQQVAFLNDVVDGEFCLLQYSGSAFTCTVVSGKLPDDVMRTGGIDVTGKDLEDKKADRDELYLASAPIGAIMAYASHVIPIGWLLCDGRTITREDYAELYDLIGDKLPDLRGQFVRGLDNGRGVDPNRELGSYQGDAIRNITGTFQRVYGEAHSSEGYKTGAFYGVKTSGKTTSAAWEADRESIGFNASRVVPTADENRPKNTALNYIIKASYLSTTVIPVTPAHELNAKIETNYRKQNEAILNNTGKSIGFNGVTYIQDDGEKVVGYLYYDKNSDGLFYCKANTSINYNSADYFEDYSNYANGNKLQNLQNSSVIIAEETFFWESGDGWSADITLRKFAKNGIVTKEVISFSKPAQRGSTIAKTYDITIPTSDKFPPKYWGVPLGVGTDDPAFGYGGSSIVEYPGKILLNFKSVVPDTNPFTLEYTWIYNL